MLRMFLCFHKWVPTDKNCLISLFQKALTPIFHACNARTHLNLTYLLSFHKHSSLSQFSNFQIFHFPLFQILWLAHLFLSQKLQHFSATTSAFHVLLFYAFLTLPAYFLLCVKFLKGLAHLIPSTASAESPPPALVVPLLLQSFQMI